MLIKELEYYMKITKDELRFNKQGEDLKKGYRIVYFYDDNYTIGEYCKTIEGFMYGFAKCNPIMDDSDIPEFISIDDLLDRYLNDLPNAISIAIYKTDGTLIAKKDRIKSHNNTK